MEASEAIMCTEIAAAAGLYCLLQTRRDARPCMQRIRRVLLALIRRPLEGRLYSRVTRAGR